MKTLPKKPNPLRKTCRDKAVKLSLGDMARKVDELVDFSHELIDYLQAKEEASKGECKCDLSVCGYHYPACPKADSPEQEGECKKERELFCNVCGERKCQHLNQELSNHPEQEDEWVIKLHMLSHQIKVGEKKWVDVEDYIKANFVSKTKIKREFQEVWKDLYGLENMDYSSEQELFERLLGSLGLE